MLSQAIHIELKDSDLQQTPAFLPFAQPSRAYACGKVILVGEHAVIYGARAVAIPVLSMRLEVVLQAVSNTLYARRRNALKTTHSENLQNVIRDALRILNCKPFPLRIEGHSNILFGAGLGASAALCVCILKAISQFFDIKLDAFELASFANQLEKRFHGTPSGLDTMTVALEKALLFAKASEPQIIHARSLSSRASDRLYPWTFAIIDSGTRSPTLAMVQESAPYFRQSAGEARLLRFDAIAELSCKGLESGDLEAVRQGMESAGRLLHEIGVVPPLLETIIERAQDCGVLSAKVTGAGGGGCVLCLLNPVHAADTLHRLQNVFGLDKVHEVTLVTA